MSTTITTSNPWTADTVLEGFEVRRYDFPPAYDGPVFATLVRRRAERPGKRAVLYLHGYGDYFFQRHLAEAYNQHGIDFYALDLRRHGRSWRPGQLLNSCRDVHEYFAEISAAIDTICDEDGCRWLLINGHSTGGLTAALYAQEGSRRDRVNALFLNSPFVEFKVDPLTRAIAPLLAALGRVAPDLKVGGLDPFYTESLHRDYRGEWDFNPGWKPIEGIPGRLGWIRAIYRAQRRLQAGLQIRCPILVMHSTRSGGGKSWNDSYTRSDCVLNVEHMRRYCPQLGSHVTMVEIEGGLHDLTLSAPTVRERVFAELFAWMERLPGDKNQEP